MSYVITRSIFRCRHLYGVGNETQDCSDPEQKGEPTEQLLTEFHPFRRRLRWAQLIRSVALQYLACLSLCESLKKQTVIFMKNILTKNWSITDFCGNCGFFCFITKWLFFQLHFQIKFIFYVLNKVPK